jgi:hypothetical protein
MYALVRMYTYIYAPKRTHTDPIEWALYVGFTLTPDGHWRLAIMLGSFLRVYFRVSGSGIII